MKTLHTFVTDSMAAMLLGTAVLFPCVGAAHAADQPEALGPNIVINGGFERGADPGPQLYVQPGSPLLENWTVIGTYLRVVGSYWQAEEGTRSLSISNPNGDSSKAMTTASGVKQTVVTTVGQRYRVTFYQAGNPWGRLPATMRCQIGGLTHDYTYQSSAADTLKKMEWVQRSFVFAATTARTDIAFYGYYTPGNMPLGLDNVQVRAIQTDQAPATTSGSTAGVAKPTLRFGAASLHVGAQQTVQVRTVKNAAVALIIDYPDGSQVLEPGHTDASGAYSYTWAIPSVVHGTVRVTVDGAGALAQATFAVN